MNWSWIYKTDHEFIGGNQHVLLLIIKIYVYYDISMIFLNILAEINTKYLIMSETSFLWVSLSCFSIFEISMKILSSSNDTKNMQSKMCRSN